MLAPTASLPPLRNLDAVSEDVVSAAIEGLVALYCPLASGVAAAAATSSKLDLLSSSSTTSVMPAGEAAGFPRKKKEKNFKTAASGTGSSTPSSTPSSGTMTPSSSTGSSMLVSAMLSVPCLDSGYASGIDGDDYDEDEDEKGLAATVASDAAHLHQQQASALAALRADHFERAFAERWLTTFLARAEEIYFSTDDYDGDGDDAGLGGCESGDGYDKRQELVDKAACVLSSFHTALDDAQEDEGVVRDLSFALWSSPGNPAGDKDANAAEMRKIKVQLNDGALNSNDHTDVGLQSWGASIVFSELLCADPARFGLVPPQPRATVSQRMDSGEEHELVTLPSLEVIKKPRRILELGAGTGLVSLALGKLLPELDEQQRVDDDNSEREDDSEGSLIVATDYHAAVLENLERNITTNFPHPPAAATAATKVLACPLDWSAPDLTTSPLDRPFDMLVATDVVYAPQHATWLRQCASRLLSRDQGAVFWLVATVRRAGKFEGISDTVRTAFAADPAVGQDGGQREGGEKVLRILEEQVLERPRGVGHGDESGYKLFRIGWA